LRIGKFRVSRKAVSPVIATLLMIAVAVAASVIVYVWSAGLLGTLMGGGGAQVKEQLILEAYDWTTLATPKLYLRNVGSAPCKVVMVYIGGSSAWSGSQAMAVKGTATITASFTGTEGTAYTVKIVTETGGVFSFSMIAGASG